MLAADFGERVVGASRQARRYFGRADQFERRIGERQHLREVAELIEQPESGVDVHQRLQAAEMPWWRRGPG